jgi:uncharacterized membrane protein YgcG
MQEEQVSLQLPTSLLVEILKHLQQQHLIGTVPLVCREWNQAAVILYQELSVRVRHRKAFVVQLAAWLQRHGLLLTGLTLNPAPVHDPHANLPISYLQSHREPAMLWKPLSVAVWSLKNLQTLDLKGFGLRRSLMHVTSLSSLTTLRLTSCCLTNSSLHYLSPMTSLKTLELPHNPDCGSDVTPLSSLQHLTLLNLTESQLADTGVGKVLSTGSIWNQLQRLNISQTFVSSYSLASLVKLQQLTALVMEGLPLMGSSAVPPLQDIITSLQQQQQDTPVGDHDRWWEDQQQQQQVQQQPFPQLQELSISGFSNLGHSWLPFKLTSLTSLNIRSIKGSCFLPFLTALPAAIAGATPTTGAVAATGAAAAMGTGAAAATGAAPITGAVAATGAATGDSSATSFLSRGGLHQQQQQQGLSDLHSQLQPELQPPQLRLQRLSFGCSSREAATALDPDVATAYASLTSLQSLTYLAFTTHLPVEAYSCLFRTPSSLSSLRVLRIIREEGDWAQDNPCPPAAVPLLVACCTGLLELQFSVNPEYPAGLSSLSGLTRLSRIEVGGGRTSMEERVVVELAGALTNMQQLRELVINGCSSSSSSGGGGGGGGSSGIGGSAGGGNHGSSNGGIGSSSSRTGVKLESSTLAALAGLTTLEELTVDGILRLRSGMVSSGAIRAQLWFTVTRRVSFAECSLPCRCMAMGAPS